MACEINITINGKVYPPLKNDRELDEFILKNEEQLSKGIELGFNKIYSLNSVDETLAKLEKVGVEYKKFLSIKDTTDNVSVGVTTLWDLFGGLINKGKSISTEYSTVKHQVSPLVVGKEVEDVLDRKFEGKIPLDAKKEYSAVTNEIQLYLLDTIKNNILPGLKELGIKVSDTTKQIKIQVGMQTRSMQEALVKEILKSTKTFEKGPENNRITKAANLIRVIEGIADVVIIDDDGVVHVGDIKTWNEHERADGTMTEFSLSGHLDYVAQVTTYQEILRQYGIPIGKGFLIAYKTEYLDDSTGNHQLLKSVKFDKILNIPRSHSIVGAIQNALWKNTSINDEKIKKAGEVLNELFPNTKLTQRLQAKELDYKFMEGAIQELTKSKNETEWNKGNRFYLVKRRVITGALKNEVVYAKTRRELIEDTVGEDGKIKKSPLKEYTDLLNKKKAARFTGFASDLMDCMSRHDVDGFEEIIMSIAPKNRSTLMHHFRRYIECNWKFKENETLNANGIYLFEKGDYIEIVVLDEENLINERIKLLHGDSILGTFMQNSSATDNRVIMSSDYGNLMLIKACALVSLDPELTRDKKILGIKALNLHNHRVYEENNTRLVTSWNMLAQIYNETHTDKLRTLSTDLTFVPDAQALVEIADEYIECAYSMDRNPKLKGVWNKLHEQVEITKEYLDAKINALQDANMDLKEDKGDYTNPLWNAYVYLRKARLALNGINLFQEKDLGRVLQGINLTGIRMRSFNSSNSPLARQMGETMANFRSAIRLEFVKQQFDWSKLIDAAYKERGFTGVLGNDWSFFEPWFEKDPTGKISTEFRLVRPSKFKGGTAERKAYEYFLEMNAKYRWPNEATREDMRDTDDWYEVPMIHAGFMQQFTAGEPLGALKYEWEKLKNASLQMIMGNPDIEKTRRQIDKIAVDALPNVINKDYEARKAYVELYGINGLEKNLDFVFLSMLYSGIRAEKSPEFCSLFTSFFVVADYMMDTSGLDIKQIRLAMEDYIKTKLFGRDIREETSFNALVGFLKNLTAKVALGWNTRAFFREVFTGRKKHFNRWLSRVDNKFVLGTKKHFIRPEFLNYSDFVSSYADVVSKIFDNASIFGFYHQLNSIYGMVNFSNEEMAEASKRHQWTVLGISDKSSVTATAPDFLHRMAILVGHLKTIGAFDAYSLNEDTGRLEYDMRKDSRFQTWLKYYKNENEITDLKTRSIFKEEKQKYEEELKFWQNTGLNINYGEYLPQALSPTAALVVKEYADEQYGNYDEETKSLVQKQTLGSLFFQYKTYGIAQFALWFSEPTYVNTLQFNYITDKDGNRIVSVPSITSEEYEKYGDRNEKPENEVTEEEWKRPGTMFKRQLGGDLFMGKAQTDYLLMSKLFTLKGDEFLQLWNENPEFRSNLYISMLDLLEMALIGLLLRIFWNTEETPIARQGFIPRWTYGVLQGMSTDGPLFQTMSGILGDGAPPVFGMVKGYYKTFMSVINGNTNLLYGITNTVGMTRELSNLFRSYR